MGGGKRDLGTREMEKSANAQSVGAGGGERELLLCTRQTLSLLFSVQTFDSTPADGLWKLFLCGITI